MKVMKAKKQILSCVLTVLLLAQAGSTAFAAQPEKPMVLQGGVKVEQIADNTLSVTSKEGTSILTVAENSTVRTVTITDSKTGHKEYMRYDKTANTLYSSITGKTVKMPLMASARTPEISYKDYFISYAQIQSAVGYTVNTAAVIGAILSYTPASEIGEAISFISDVVDTMNNTIYASPDHGIRVTIKRTSYYRHRPGTEGHIPYATHYIITSSGLY